MSIVPPDLTWRGRARASARHLRAVPWSVWALLLLGGLYFVRGVLPPGFSPLGALAGAGPILFAAAVLYRSPADRRYRWAALALATQPVVSLASDWIPTVWQQLAPGDWANAVPLMLDGGVVARDVATLIELAGLGLLGLALGGVRVFVSAVILGAAALVALANLTWLFAHPVEQLPLVQLAKSIVYPTLTTLGWAFVFAAALESLRSLTLTGAGLVCANVVVNSLLLWWTIGPEANMDLLSLAVVLPLAAGWLAMIAGVLRDELDPAVARGARARGKRARR